MFECLCLSACAYADVRVLVSVSVCEQGDTLGAKGERFSDVGSVCTKFWSAFVRYQSI